MRAFVISVLLFSLVGCGSSQRSSTRPVAVPFAAGPLQVACEQADRKNASRRLCGCIQAVADQQLTSSDQSRAVPFFFNSALAEDAKGGSRFWKRYRAFSNQAKQICEAA